jgi:hypothetical protein
MSPQNWVIEGKTCDAEWLELDRREKDDSLKGKNVTGTFPVSRAAEIYEIRLRQTGRNHGGKDCLVVSSFEIFGSLVQTMRWQKFPRELAKANQFLSKATRVGRFPPLVKRRKFNIPDGIIAHLTRECGGNVHDCHVIEVTSGSFKRETIGANPDSGAYNNDPGYAAKNVADLEVDSHFYSAYRSDSEAISHTRNNWVCYNFKEMRIVPTHYAIRTNSGYPGWQHLKSWLVETSEDGETWLEVDHKEDNNKLNGESRIGTFAVASGKECRFIRLVNIGRNHRGSDQIWISAWEIFGSLIE